MKLIPADGSRPWLLLVVLASGFVLLSTEVLSLEVRIAGNFLDVVRISGRAFFSSEGEFEIIIDGRVKLGSGDFNINGGAHLEVGAAPRAQRSAAGRLVPRVRGLEARVQVRREASACRRRVADGAVPRAAAPCRCARGALRRTPRGARRAA